ncbi:hypothetical protein AVEN_67721-1 [Araneus ventricosus]|uniref:Uncharacterized protein n=1 Tax=Araneus ventricosus TaxID=182803 RepID=A0A4Y2S9H2_ARAVE|nr:hypothetical protein AVEN_67721-1 [Araneus ventricosus]
MTTDLTHSQNNLSELAIFQQNIVNQGRPLADRTNCSKLGSVPKLANAGVRTALDYRNRPKLCPVGPHAFQDRHWHPPQHSYTQHPSIPRTRS